jgi:hypothetical protein
LQAVLFILSENRLPLPIKKLRINMPYSLRLTPDSHRDYTLRLIAFPLLFALLFCSCGETDPSGENQKVKITESASEKMHEDSLRLFYAPDSTLVHTNRKYNDIARYIAGMKQLPGSPLIPLEKDTFWMRYARVFDAAWKILDQSRLSPMQKWSVNELSNQHKMNLDIFYPLSGPDILHVYTFFPMVKQYHLYALEIAGVMPDLQHLAPWATHFYLNEVYLSLGDVFKRSYFITSKMETFLQQGFVDGTLPLICLFLVRSNHEILNVKYYHLNDDGSETRLKDSSAVHYNDFVKVYFRNNKDSTVQIVTYMQCDLSNNAFMHNTGLTNYYNNMPLAVTYLKSGSYLLHQDMFSLIRNVILYRSHTILEDDTGIPFRFFPWGKWNVSLYGVYVKPVADFSGVFQTDLQKAYTDMLLHKPKTLPFSLGYHWGSNAQNLIKAERKG